MTNGRKSSMSVVVGLLSAMIVLNLLEYLNSRMFPVSIDSKDPVAIKAAIASLPTAAKLLHILCYFISAFVGGFVATKFNKTANKNPALIVGGILTFLGLVNTVSMGEELWMAALTLVIYLPGAYLGYKMAAGKQVAS